jgi:hypothetical protein
MVDLAATAPGGGVAGKTDGGLPARGVPDHGLELANSSAKLVLEPPAATGSTSLGWHRIVKGPN